MKINYAFSAVNLFLSLANLEISFNGWDVDYQGEIDVHMIMCYMEVV